MNFSDIILIKPISGTYRLAGKFKTFLIIFILIIIFISCVPEKLAVKEIIFERGGEVIASIKAEIAENPEERSLGLMYRKELKDGEGMLFVFDNDALHSFWMKNTLIPLSIAFVLYDGRILEIKDMYPKDLTSVVPSRSIRYALEVPQGWFKRAGIRDGDVLKW
ncbi:MAG: DUF192 domain-containing protein [Treponema sp.]|jgi:uncharacterized membrane protein (UPF0127 family)|nr:DUF192 domain-containing protein [Treponema sp.]